MKATLEIEGAMHDITGEVSNFLLFFYRLNVVSKGVITRVMLTSVYK